MDRRYRSGIQEARKMKLSVLKIQWDHGQGENPSSEVGLCPTGHQQINDYEGEGKSTQERRGTIIEVLVGLQKHLRRRRWCTSICTNVCARNNNPDILHEGQIRYVDRIFRDKNHMRTVISQIFRSRIDTYDQYFSLFVGAINSGQRGA